MNGNACSHDWIRLHVEKASWEHVNTAGFLGTVVGDENFDSDLSIGLLELPKYICYITLLCLEATVLLFHYW